jgi:hypothetical protein
LKETEVLLKALFDAVTSDVSVSDAEVREHFEQNPREYAQRLITLRRASYASEEAAEAAIAALGASGRLAPHPSEEIGPLAPRDLPRRWRRAARRLREPGAHVTVRRGESWWVFQLVDEKWIEPSFEEARQRVANSLREARARERFAAEIESVRERTEIRVEASALGDDSLWQRPP